MALKNLIRQKAYELGFDLIGFSEARELTQVREYLTRRVREARATSLEWQNIRERVEPAAVMSNVRTVITLGMSYNTGPGAKGAAGQDPAGKISRSAWGRDYHRVMGERLNQLAEFIAAAGGAAKAFVDTGPPVDRALAVEGGLGWAGKNCALINPVFGSWVFLGQLYTDLVLETDRPSPHDCGECELCLRACPTGALQEAYIINPHRCISYLTQMKGFVPVQLRQYMGNNIYGCDTCQNVCPANRSARLSPANEFVPTVEVSAPSLLRLLKLSNREFKQIYGESAAAWRGKTVLQRNCLIALGNLKGREYVPEILGYLKDERPVIRGHAAWALGQIGDTAALEDLERALPMEKDPQVQAEIQAAINKLRDDANPIAVSACLAGHCTKYNGGHNEDKR
ncbi:MAG TPA: tRNA epoxyqueuosine(34) reductase QueG, partial [Verrucomicrobiae bacterium]|nr:tRNA epoxyqueuosine(34) reductase QueG [Verrucomicrobiae bacterium]